MKNFQQLKLLASFMPVVSAVSGTSDYRLSRHTPILQGGCQLPGDPFGGQIDQLQQRHIADKDALIFGDLTDLPVISLGWYWSYK